jgi:dipeptidyl aminopeptidase/acylaminoacyl peptidase
MKPTHLLPFIIVPIALFGGVVAGFMSARDQPKVARQPPAYQQSFAKARKSFQTQLQRQEFSNDPVPNPPRTIARKVKFSSSAGQLSAYITLPPAPAKPSNSTKPTAPAKSPAIVWLGGGFCNCIDGDFWKPAPRSNDQTASAFRKAGIITMYPARRGGNEKVGIKEGFYGEVDDVLAAVDYLAKQPGVDPTRIYLGGHSTGGTLALLVAAAGGKNRFRSVFAFGPVDEIAGYGDELPFDLGDRKERLMRSPKVWLNSIQSPTFVIEGTERGNLDSLQTLAKIAEHPNLRFYPVTGADHFTVLAPINDYLAKKILQDKGPTSNIQFQPNELNQIFASDRTKPKAQFRRQIFARN